LVRVILSESGVRQGSVLGPVLFALTIQDTLEKISKLQSVELARAYLDDVNLVVNPLSPSLQSDLATAERLLLLVGLRINQDPTKSFILAKGEVQRLLFADGGAIHVSAETSRVLGGFLGGSENQQAGKLSTKIQKHDRFFKNLHRVRDPSIAFHLLRVAGLPRANFFFRTHDPRISRDAAEWFDGRVWNELLRILEVSVTPDEVASTVIQLPAKMGGLAIRPYVPYLNIMYQSREKGTQHLAIHAKELVARKYLFDTLPAELRQIFISGGQKGATRIVTDHSMEVSPSAFIIGMKSRMLTMPLLDAGVRCPCGEPGTYHHFNVCPRLRGGGKIDRHDQVTIALHDWLAQLNIRSTYVKRSLSWKNRSRTDLKIFRRGRNTLQVDTSITSPGRWIRTGGSRQPFVAAELRRKEKNDKFLAACRQQGHEFKPFVFETTGAVPKTTRELVSSLLTVSNIEVRQRVRDFANELYQAVIAAIHEGNADIVGSALEFMDLKDEQDQRTGSAAAPGTPFRGTRRRVASMQGR
jgi:hypothetical protein